VSLPAAGVPLVLQHGTGASVARRGTALVRRGGWAAAASRPGGGPGNEHGDEHGGEHVTIKAVVLDIGGVLEVIDDSVFPGLWPARLGMTATDFLERLDGLPGDPTVGDVTWEEVLAHWRGRLGLDDAATVAIEVDFWRWYVGTLDVELFDWFAAQRSHRLTAILSNSSPGAREHERQHGFEDVVDLLVYSHEVGLAKPDPAIYELTARRLGVRPEEIAFLDDDQPRVEGARRAGWHAVLHVSTPQSIEAMERIIAGD
jgi:FMN phosphatase YigB (HAD superfamily)